MLRDADRRAPIRWHLPYFVASAPVRPEVDGLTVARPSGLDLFVRIVGNTVQYTAVRLKKIQVSRSFATGIEQDGLRVGRPLGIGALRAAHRGHLNRVRTVSIRYPDLFRA